MKIKTFFFLTAAGVFFIFHSDLFAQCKVKPIVKTCKSSLAPYVYDSYAVKEIEYGPKEKKESIEFAVYSGEQYKLVFCQTQLPKEVGITIYVMKAGKREIIYFDESGKKSTQDFNFGPTTTGTYYIEYDIPPATAPNQKGCFVLLIGIKG